MEACSQTFTHKTVWKAVQGVPASVSLGGRQFLRLWGMLGLRSADRTLGNTCSEETGQIPARCWRARCHALEGPFCLPIGPGPLGPASQDRGSPISTAPFTSTVIVPRIGVCQTEPTWMLERTRPFRPPRC